MMKNFQHTFETKRKIGEANKRRIIKPETRLKMSLSRKGMKLTDEWKKKIGASQKGRISGMYGKKHSDKTKKIISLKTRGKNNPFFGKHHTKEIIEKIRKQHIGTKMNRETRNKISKSHAGRKHSIKHNKNVSKALNGRRFSCEHKNNLKLAWQNPIIREKRIKNSLKALFKRPTSLENRLIELIGKNNLPFKYVGDGAFLIGYKNPDFINTNGEKICVEVRPKVMCPIWDKCTPEEYAEKRKSHYAKFGWECIVLWHEDLLELEKKLCQQKV